MKCAGCQRELEIGDQFIEGTASDYLGEDSFDDLIGAIMGSGVGNKIIYCEDCTVSGGDFKLQTYYGDE